MTIQLTITTTELEMMLERAAQKGAEKAIKEVGVLEEWVRGQKAMKMLGCGETTLRKLVNEGKVVRNRVGKYGKLVRYSVKSINNYLNDEGCKI